MYCTCTGTLLTQVHRWRAIVITMYVCVYVCVLLPFDLGDYLNGSELQGF